MKIRDFWMIGASAFLLAGCAQHPAPTNDPNPTDRYVTLTVPAERRVWGAQATVQYDPGQLEYVGVQSDDPSGTALGYASDGRLNLAMLAPQGSNGTLFSAVVFREKVPGAAVRITSLRGVTEDEREVALSAGSLHLNPTASKPRGEDAVGAALQAEQRTAQNSAVGALGVAVPSSLDPGFVHFPLGDCNQDGQFSISDAVRIAQLAAGQNPAATAYQKYTSDLDSNGQVSLGDAVIALQKLVNPNVEARLAVAPQRLSLGAGQSATVLVANAGNKPLPTVTNNLPAGVTLNNVSGPGSQGAAYRLTVGPGGASGLVAFLGGTAGNDVVQLNPAQTSGTVSGVTLDTGNFSLALGATRTVTATVQGRGRVSQAVSWSSSNPAVAGVDSAGVVSAKAAGTSTISGASVQDPSKRASLTVTVTGAPSNAVARVTVSGPEQLKLNTPTAFRASARGADGSLLNGKTFTWSSSDPSVATVDASGNVTAKHFGTVTIRATADGVNGNSAAARTYGLEAFGGVRDNGYDTAFYLRYRTSTGTLPNQSAVVITLNGPADWNNNQPVVFHKPSYFFEGDGSGGHWFELDWVGNPVVPVLGTYTVDMTVDGQDWSSTFSIGTLTNSVPQSPDITVTDHTSTSATAVWNDVAPNGSYMIEVLGFYPPEHVNVPNGTVSGLTLTPASTYHYAVSALSLDVTKPVTAPIGGQFDVRFGTQGFTN